MREAKRRPKVFGHWQSIIAQLSSAPLMANIKPFAAVRPRPDLAARICELPYDVLSTEEARQAAAGNPLSFFHVSKPEIDLQPGTDPYAPQVYTRATENWQRLQSEGALRQDSEPCFYLYRQIMGVHVQVGLVAAASCQDYLKGTIKKHELTRPDKEDDRVRQIEALDAQTGPVFLVCPANRALDKIISAFVGDEPRVPAAPPDVDFKAPDGVRHTCWTIAEKSMLQLVSERFAATPALYIADGHHRCAAAARISQRRKGSGQSGYFLSVIFPHNQVQILAYNRVLKDLNGLSPDQLLEKLDGVFLIQSNGAPVPTRQHQLGLYLGGKWLTLHFRPRFASTSDPLEKLDANLLQNYVLAPIFGIDDPRTSKRIQFVGGIRGSGELEKLVRSGEYACALSMFPTSMESLMAVADAGGIMPPKSTWFEPKLRDGMFSHLI
jgi:uncharacterized protein (DUF1015 family)